MKSLIAVALICLFLGGIIGFVAGLDPAIPTPPPAYLNPAHIQEYLPGSGNTFFAITQTGEVYRFRYLNGRFRWELLHEGE